MILRMQCTFAADSTAVRDLFTITPHFATRIDPTPDVDALCEDLAQALFTWQLTASTREVRVRAYDAESAPPNYPLGDAVRGVGLAAASQHPREVACCLSFYSERNLPRQRGRLYLPATLLTGSQLGVRPTNTLMTKVTSLGPILAGIGGVDVDWVVWSRSDREERPVTNYYADDEWDVIRKRGLRPTTRVTGTTTEAAAP